MTEGNGGINYSVKELLARIEGKLDLLSTQMQQKADVSQVASIISRVEKIEREGASQSAVNRYRNWLFITAAPAALGAAYAAVKILERF